MRSQTQTAAFGLYFSGVDLQSVAGELSRAGVPPDDISVVLPASHPAAKTLRSLKTGTCAPGAVSQVQDVLTWLSKFGSVVIPGVGLFLTGRAFTGTLFGAACEDHVCNRVLHNLGMPDAEAERYEEWVNLGGSVAYVCSDDSELVQHACETLEDAGAEEVSWMDEGHGYSEFGFQHLLQAS